MPRGETALTRLLHPSQAAQQGAWAAARHAYERGLECDPAHPSLQDKLLLLLLHIGDAGAAKAVAAEILRRNPHHATARALASGRSVSVGGGKCDAREALPPPRGGA